MLAIQKGDILTGLVPPYMQHPTLILHGCNCFHTMGAGIALRLRKQFPEVYMVDIKQTIKGDPSKLGHFTVANISTNLKVLNCYTQLRYGRDRRYVEYWAVESVLRAVAIDYTTHWRIRMPKIGCSNAGGDWNVILPIIERELQMHDVTVYYL